MSGVSWCARIRVVQTEYICTGMLTQPAHVVTWLRDPIPPNSRRTTKQLKEGRFRNHLTLPLRRCWSLPPPPPHKSRCQKTCTNPNTQSPSHLYFNRQLWGTCAPNFYCILLIIPSDFALYTFPQASKRRNWSWSTSRPIELEHQRLWNFSMHTNFE